MITGRNGLITVFMGYKAREVKLSYEMARILPAGDSTTTLIDGVCTALMGHIRGRDNTRYLHP